MIKNNQALICISKLKLEIKKSLSNKNFSAIDLDNLLYKCRQLMRLTSYDDSESYIFFGKINLLKKDYKSAKESFFKAKMLNEKKAASYHGLFKINVVENQYQEALENIQLYEKYSGISCDIYICLLHHLLDYNDFEINEQNTILGQNISYQPLICNYHLLIEKINHHHYLKALKHLDICCKLIQRKNYHIDLSYLEQLLKKVYEKEANKEEVNALEKELFISSNSGYDYLLLNKLYTLKPNNIELLFSLIEINLVYANYDQSMFYLNEVKKLTKENKKIEYYENIIRENIGHDDDIMKYTQLNFEIDNLIATKNYQQALEKCNNYFMKTNNYYFLYKAGTILYKLKKYAEAKTFFMHYIKSGKYTYLKATYYYLFYINYKLEEDYYHDASLILSYSLLDLKPIDVDTFINLLLKNKDFNSNYLWQFEKSLLLMDKRKEKVLK